MSIAEMKWRLLGNFGSYYSDGIISVDGRMASSDHALCLKRGLVQIGEHLLTIRELNDPHNEYTFRDLGRRISGQMHGDGQVPDRDVVASISQGKIEPHRDDNILCVATRSYSFAWSPCGNYIATGSCGPENVVRVTDIRSGELIFAEKAHEASVDYLDWSPGGKYLVSGAYPLDPTVKVWGCHWEAAGSELRLNEISYVGKIGPGRRLTPQEERARANDVIRFSGFRQRRVSPDERSLAVEGRVKGEEYRIHIFELPLLNENGAIELQTEQADRTISEDVRVVESQATGICWSHTGETLYFCQYGSLYSSPINEQGEPGRATRIPVYASRLSLHPSGQMIATGVGVYCRTAFAKEDVNTDLEFLGGAIGVYRTDSWDAVSEFEGSSGVAELQWSRTGDRLWAACQDGNVYEGRLHD